MSTYNFSILLCSYMLDVFHSHQTYAGIISIRLYNSSTSRSVIFWEERLNAVKEMNSEVECLRGKVPQKLHIAIGHVVFELPKSSSYIFSRSRSKRGLNLVVYLKQQWPSQGRTHWGMHMPYQLSLNCAPPRCLYIRV